MFWPLKCFNHLYYFNVYLVSGLYIQWKSKYYKWFLEFILYILIPEYGQLNSPLISCNINIIELIYNRSYMLMYLMTAPGVYIS